MNAWERGSSWRRRLLIGWLALGWVIAVVLVVSRGLPIGIAQAAGGASEAAFAHGRGPYSPIGLTFDTCGSSGKYVWAIAQSPNSPVAASSSTYRYAGTIHNVRVKVIDGASTYNSNSTNLDLLIYVLDPTTCKKSPRKGG